ncbi:MAG: 4-(cytidine 5'-diphospho)-2-C-methyl-D-erythritol kinase [Chlamydiae bacterium]|nr:4-(cytidine 5'-diphospho)-2-C-methyl-D-erythritol kinase [Chlamydiota bacterium]
MLKKNNYFFSPAKINLFFKVLGKRTDGYHEIASLYQAINIFDVLQVNLQTHDYFSCSDKNLISENNLILRALDIFRDKTKLKFGVFIHLEKKIPIEAGLGGGSSNAATILFALNALLEKPATEDELKSWAAEIGSDIPFFFSSGTAYCKGRGEIVEDLSELQNFPNIYIAKPFFGLSTKLVYQKVDLNKLLKRTIPKSFDNFLLNPQDCFNDLEEPAFLIEERLIHVKNQLSALGFTKILLTGSGTSFICFGDVDDPKLQDVSFYKVTNIQRNKPDWYPNN